MGIISILFLVFGWIFAIKGLVIVSLVLSSLFATILILCTFMASLKTNKKYYEGIFDIVIQFTILILSIVKLVNGF